MATRPLIRLIVASPDRLRVLGRPNGLAGWRLPAVAVAGARNVAADWTEDELTRAAVGAGGPVEPETKVDEGVWEFQPIGRIGAAGTTWIAVTDAERLGVDAAPVRTWTATTPL